MSRLRSSSKNVFFGMLQQFITLILTFVTRTVFIKYLNIELLGVNSLFSNILTVLSIADLGFGTAILYSMYKPIAEKDEKKLCELMNFYKKIYTKIALIIFIIGISLLPFLKYLIKENNIDNIELYYLLFLIDSVVSYLYAYKVNIINADQKTYIIKEYTLVFYIIRSILQCIVIIIWKNFFIYLLIQILTTMSINIYGAYIAKKMYPFINNKGELDNEEKNKIIDNVKSLFIYKIGGVILNNTDNILISSILGVAIVGYYTNYYTIINAISSITLIIFSTITYSVGNLVASDSKKKQYEIFKKLEFFVTILFSFTSITLVILMDDFIKCWLGSEYIIDFPTVIAIVLNFYMYGVLNSIFMYRDTTGLFNKTKYLSIITSIINIMLSIVLGNIIGLFGIIIATAISRLLTSFWYEPYTLHKIYFSKSTKNYFKFRILNIFYSVCISCILFIIFKKFQVDNWLDFIIKGIFTGFLIIISMILIYRKNSEFKYYINLFKNILVKLKNNVTNKI